MALLVAVVVAVVVVAVVVVAVVVVAVVLPGPAAAVAPGAGAGAWGWPLPGRSAVLRPFAPGTTPYSPGHYGVDLAAAAGTPVLAPGDGRVAYAGLVAGRGVLVLEHGGLRTSYEPVEALVALGEQVARGDVVGLVEPLGHACPGLAGCLHWGLRRTGSETYLDPLRLLRRPVRLLPRSGGAGEQVAGQQVAGQQVAGQREARLRRRAGPPRGGVPPEVAAALGRLLPVAGLALALHAGPP